MTFAIITPALTVGAFAERMKFGALLLFIALWFTFIYAPLAHMVWSGPGALLWDWGVLDFAGGTVVHVNAGIAGLDGRARDRPPARLSGRRDPAAQRALCAGRRRAPVGRLVRLQRGQRARGQRHGGHGGPRHAGRDRRRRAVVDGFEWAAHGKPSALGVATGAIAGLVAITPASGTAGPPGALLIGLLAGGACFLAATRLKRISVTTIRSTSSACMPSAASSAPC